MSMEVGLSCGRCRSTAKFSSSSETSAGIRAREWHEAHKACEIIPADAPAQVQTGFGFQSAPAVAIERISDPD